MAIEVRFGNLTVAQFEEKTEVKLSKKDIKWLEERRIDKAEFKDDNKFHIFDKPFTIVAGHDVFDELVTRLRQYNFEAPFAVQKKEKEATEAAS